MTTSHHHSTAMSISTPAYLDLSDDEDTLPYPAPLPRSDFLAPDFDPSAYLSTLRNRHQTLEDLRGDLRARSQLLNQELLDLVNGNYEEFLGLGGDLRDGEEKVENVRLGVLGFQREIEGVRKAVRGRLEEVNALLEERRAVREQVVQGRALLEVEEQIGELEESLGMKGEEDEFEADDDDDEDEDDDDDDTSTSKVRLTIPLKKLQRHAQKYLLITRAVRRIGPEHPFLVAQQPRLDEVKKTLLLDLAAALRQAKEKKASDIVLAVIKIYGDLDAEAESIKVLKAG